MERLTCWFAASKYSEAPREALIARLYDYEQSRLSPEEVMELKEQSKKAVVESPDFERLTWRSVDGTSFYTEASQQELIDRLAAYENTCLKPEEIQRMRFHQWRKDRWNNNLSEAPAWKLLQVKVKELEWISDYASDKVPDEEKRYHSQRIFETVGAKREDGTWEYAECVGDGIVVGEAYEIEPPEHDLGVFEAVVLEWREV